MKRLSLGFTALIAVLTMSFTVLTKEVKPTVSDGCYTSIQTDQNPSIPTDPIYSWNAANVPSNPDSDQPDLANGSSGFPTNLGFTVVTASGALNLVAGSCVEVYEPLCCYEVENNIVIAVKYGSYVQ